MLFNYEFINFQLSIVARLKPKLSYFLRSPDAQVEDPASTGRLA